MTPKGAREIHPQLGEYPGPNEVGFAMCEYGHTGQMFSIGDDVDIDIPKGEHNPYCVGCIMLHAIKQAKLKPMKFYAARRPERTPAPAPLPPDIVVPDRGLFVPEGAMDEMRRRAGREGGE